MADFLKVKVMKEISGRELIVEVLNVCGIDSWDYDMVETIIDHDMDPTAQNRNKNSTVGKILKCRVMRRNDRNKLEVDDVQVIQT